LPLLLLSIIKWSSLSLDHWRSPSAVVPALRDYWDLSVGQACTHPLVLIAGISSVGQACNTWQQYGKHNHPRLLCIFSYSCIRTRTNAMGHRRLNLLAPFDSKKQLVLSFTSGRPTMWNPAATPRSTWFWTETCGWQPKSSLPLTKLLLFSGASWTIPHTCLTWPSLTARIDYGNLWVSSGWSHNLNWCKYQLGCPTPHMVDARPWRLFIRNA